mgnify:CR=1 FL=1
MPHTIKKEKILNNENSHDTDSIDSKIYHKINNINFSNNNIKKRNYNEMLENSLKFNEIKNEVEPNNIIKK